MSEDIDYDALISDALGVRTSDYGEEYKIRVRCVKAIRALRAAAVEIERDAERLNKALSYVVKDLKVRAGTSGVVELGNGAWYQANKALEEHAAMAAQEKANG